MRKPYPQHSSTARKIVRRRGGVRAGVVVTFVLTIVLALVSYWLGYMRGSSQVPQAKVQIAAPTPVQLAFKRTPGFPEGDPAIKYGPTPIGTGP